MTKTESAEHLIKTLVIESCEQLLDFHGAEGVRAAIPNTNNLIMVGTPEWIAKNVPGVEAMVAGALPDAMQNIAAMVWEQALSDAAFYVAGHCANGEHHVDDIMSMRMPKISFAATTQASTAQAEPANVLRTVRRLLDGSQTKDIPTAIMVIDTALKQPGAWSYDIAPPQGFIDYVSKNYTGDVTFHDPEWHALRLWNAAMKNAKPPFISVPVATSSTDAQAAAEVRDAVRNAVAKELTGVYYCGRVWSAWGVGTMSEDDFTPAAEVDEVLDEITDAAIRALRAGDTDGAAAKVCNGCEHCIGTYCLSGEKCRHCGHEAEGQGIKRAGDTGEQADGGAA